MSDVRKLLPKLAKEGIAKIYIIDPTDNWLEKRIYQFKEKLELVWYNNPLFINTKEELASFFKPAKKKFFQTSFYKNERKNRNILMDGKNHVGGKLSFDSENRKKYPKTKIPPIIQFPAQNKYHKEAIGYVNKNFSKNSRITKHIKLLIMKKLIEKALEFETRKMRFPTTSDRIMAAREAKDLVLSLNEVYKKNKDEKTMDIMKRLTVIKQRIEKRLKGKPLTS